MQPGRVGPYTLLQVLGTGSLGQVLLGRTPKGARVAVKVFRPELVAHRGFRVRLREEFDVASRVRGMRVAAVLDADLDAARPWLALEYVPGPPLHEVLAAQGPLDPPAARRLGMGLAEALMSIHEAGAVHGDLKPANVLLAPDGPHVTDVGLARAAAATPLTRGGALIGTLGYLAPEQVLGGRAQPASDVFALGSLLLLASTWRRPFGDGDATAVLDRVLRGDPDLAGVGGEVATVVEACLTRPPERRPGPEQVHETLATAVRAETGSAPAVVRVPAPRRPAEDDGVWPATPVAARGVAAPVRPLSRGHRVASATAVTALLAGVFAVTAADARADAAQPVQRTASAEPLR